MEEIGLNRTGLGDSMASEQAKQSRAEQTASGNRKPLLLIFIDGFPHYVLKKDNFFIGQLDTVAPLQPGFGFSVNIFAELYAGLTPDDAGYLNIWELEQGDDFGRTAVRVAPLKKAAQRIVDRFTRRPQQFSRLLHKVYERIVHEGNIGNIPFSYLPYFRRSSGARPINYIFDEPGMMVFRHEQIPGSIWDRDEAAYARALDSVKRGDSVFVTFGSLDHTGHLAGPGSPRFVQRAKLVDGWCKEMIEAFLAAHSQDGHVVICSDHGHTDVHATVSLDFEKRFGKPGFDTYWYFLDSTMARVWVKDQQLRGRIAEFLGHHPDGTLLDDAKRAEYGISNQSFMDLLFVLHAGKTLWPSWTGGRFPKGMHGYLPKEPSQQGIFVFHGPDAAKEHPLPLPIRSRDVYHFLRRLAD